MSPLHVRLSRPAAIAGRHRIIYRWGRSATAIGLLLALCAGTVGAQNNPVPPNTNAPVQPAAPAIINFRERPKYPTDPQRLRRTVQIDGVLNDGEWDPFYTITDGPIKGVVYCNWDDNYLYLAARTEQPATVLFDVDMGGDGWLRGADNLEVVVGGVTDGSPLTVASRLLDAANSKDTPAWNETAVEARTIQAAGKVTNGTQVIEIAIPKNTASLVLRSGASIGLRAEFLPPGPASAYAPTQAFEPHLLLDARLVDARVQVAPGLNPRLTLSDNKCIAGQTLFATLELLNQTDMAKPIKSITWAGQGNSVNVVNTLREVTVPPAPALKTLKRTYRTPLPPDVVPGSYLLTVTVEFEDGKQVQSASAFSVVEPLQAHILGEPEPLAIVGQTKFVLGVDVFSAVPREFHGDVELTAMPAGWELQGGKKRGVAIDREDAHKVTRFTFKVPSTTPAGDYAFEATVTWHGRVWKLKHSVSVVRTDAPKK